jgi:predicted RNase H-like nuclease (RuvC/YqgF family)
MRKISRSELSKATSSASGEDIFSQLQRILSMGDSLEKAIAAADKLKTAEPRLAALEKRYESLWKSIENLHAITQRIEKAQSELSRYIDKHDKEHARIDSKLDSFGADVLQLTQNAIREFKAAAASLREVASGEVNVTIPEIRIPDIRIPEISVIEKENDGQKEIDFTVNRDSRGLITSVTAKEKGK